MFWLDMRNIFYPFNLFARMDYLDLNVIDSKKVFMATLMGEMTLISLNFIQRLEALCHILSQPFIAVPQNYSRTSW